MRSPEGGSETIAPYCAGGTASVACKGEPTKSGYLDFETGGMSAFNWSSKGDPDSYTIKPLRVQPGSEPINPTTIGETEIPLDDSCKSFTHTLRMGEYYTTRYSKRVNQTKVHLRFKSILIFIHVHFESHGYYWEKLIRSPYTSRIRDSSSSFSSWLAFVFRWYAHSRAVMFHRLHRGQRVLLQVELLPPGT